MKHIDAIQPLIDSIAQARKAKKLTQEELGRRLGLPQSYISRLESGWLDVRLSGIVEIARYFGLEMMLVPVAMVPTVNSAIGEGKATRAQVKPLYTLDDLEEESL